MEEAEAQEQRGQGQQQEQPMKLMSVSELAIELPFHPQTIYKLLKKHPEIPRYRVGERKHRYRVNYYDVMRVIEQKDAPQGS